MMKPVLSAVTLSGVLVAPAWAFDSATILEKGKILFHRETTTVAESKETNDLMELVRATDMVGVAYAGKVFVCEIIAKSGSVRCFAMNDKGVYELQE